MSAVEAEQAALPAAGKRPRRRLRRVGLVLLAVFAAQYTITTIIVGLSVAATLHYYVTPQIVATFETLAVALKR
jgi:hypothetical protein